MVSSTIVASKCSSNLLTHFFLAKPLIRSLAQPQLFGAMSAQIARNRDSWWVMQKLSIFFRPTPYGFRQVVQHVSNHVACEIN